MLVYLGIGVVFAYYHLLIFIPKVILKEEPPELVKPFLKMPLWQAMAFFVFTLFWLPILVLRTINRVSGTNKNYGE